MVVAGAAVPTVAMPHSSTDVCSYQLGQLPTPPILLRRVQQRLWGHCRDMVAWGAMSFSCVCVFSCLQDHSTQLSRTGTLSRKGIKSQQSAGTMG